MFFNEPNINQRNDYGYNNHEGPGGRNTEDIMTVGEWIGVLIVLAIPILNIVMYFFWAFSSGTNENLKNFCRASLIIGGIAIFLGVLLGGCSAW